MLRPLALLALLLALPARADELPVVSQIAVATPARTEADHDLGLELLWLPVESRTSVTDFVARNHPGAQFDREGHLVISGGHPNDVAYELDGYRFSHLTAPLPLLGGFDVANAGYGAAWSDAIGVIGARTRAASSRLHADIDAYNDVNDSEVRAGTVSVSTPVVHDRLFVDAVLRGDRINQPALRDPAGIIAPTLAPRERELNLALKMIWQPTANHRLESLTLFDDGAIDGLAKLGVEPEAQPGRRTRDAAAGLRWTGRFGEVITASSQLAVDSHRAEELPLLCRYEPNCEFIPPREETVPPTGSAASNLLKFNWLRHQIGRETGLQAFNTLTARIADRPVVRERLRVTSRVDARTLESNDSVPGDEFYEDANGRPSALTTYYANDPLRGTPTYGVAIARASTLRTMHSLESETRLFDRVWVVPGLGLTTARANADDLTFVAAAVTPHLGLAWDARGDGRTWLHASSHQRASTDVDQVVRLGLGAPASKRCQWNADDMRYDKSCVFSGGRSRNTAGLPCGVANLAPDGTPCASGLHLQRWWEHTLGASHQLRNGVRFSADLVYRRSIVEATVNETNRSWNASGTDVVGYRNGRAETIYDYSAAPDDSERYLGITAAIAKQTGALHTLLSYTWSRHRNGTYVVPELGQQWPIFGVAPDDRPHSFRARLSYDLLGYASFGLLFSRDSGLPINRNLRKPGDVFGSYENYRAATPTNPGANINDPTNTSPERNPDVSRLNLQLRLRARRLLGVDGDLYVDAIDLISSGGPEPTYFRVGVTTRY